MGHTDKRILVVEDEDGIRALLLAIFRRRGFTVDTAANGLEALRHCERCRYALVLLDVMMPLMDGPTFLEQLCARGGARPIVIVMTAAGTPPSLDPELIAGTIRKPFDIELLIDAVTACLQALPDVDQPDACPPAESDGRVQPDESN